MNTEMQRYMFAPLIRGLFVCLLGSNAFTAAAAPINEAESNDAISSAQPITVVTEGLTISGVIGDSAGTPNTDVDFFTFTGTQGDSPVIAATTLGTSATDPDGNVTCSGFAGVVTLYDSELRLLTESTANCLNGTDAKIEGYALEATGTYYLAVAEWPHVGNTGAVTQGMFFQGEGGDYKVDIGGVRTSASTPRSVKDVPIRVKHWHQDERDLGRRNGRDPITVVILSMAESATNKFEATTVNVNSLTFGATGKEKSLYRCRKEGKDVNHDGHLDMVCYFNPEIASFKTDDRIGLLRGKTNSGQEIKGSAALKIFTMSSEKRGFKRHERHNSDRGDRKNDKNNGKS